MDVFVRMLAMGHEVKGQRLSGLYDRRAAL